MTQYSLFPEIFNDDQEIEGLDMNAMPTHEDVSILMLAFMRRLIMDASGPDTIDSYCSKQDQQDARIYLTQGYIAKQGYYFYDERYLKKTKKRIKDADCEKFIRTPNQPQYSPIPLFYILDHMNIEHECFFMYISNWKENQWSKNDPWFKQFIENTKFLEN